MSHLNFMSVTTCIHLKSLSLNICCSSCISSQDGVFNLSDKEIQMLVESKTIPGHQLEKVLKDPARAVKIR